MPDGSASETGIDAYLRIWSYIESSNGNIPENPCINLDLPCIKTASDCKEVDFANGRHEPEVDLGRINEYSDCWVRTL